MIYKGSVLLICFFDPDSVAGYDGTCSLLVFPPFLLLRQAIIVVFITIITIIIMIYIWCSIYITKNKKTNIMNGPLIGGSQLYSLSLSFCPSFFFQFPPSLNKAWMNDDRQLLITPFRLTNYKKKESKLFFIDMLNRVERRVAVPCPPAPCNLILDELHRCWHLVDLLLYSSFLLLLDFSEDVKQQQLMVVVGNTPRVHVSERSDRRTNPANVVKRRNTTKEKGKFLKKNVFVSNKATKKHGLCGIESSLQFGIKKNVKQFFF